jgi:hypothetical protein
MKSASRATVSELYRSQAIVDDTEALDRSVDDRDSASVEGPFSQLRSTWPAIKDPAVGFQPRAVALPADLSDHAGAHAPFTQTPR